MEKQQDSYILSEQPILPSMMQSSELIVSGEHQISFEQGLNENIRIALRLEHLFKQFKHHINSPNIQNARSAMKTMLAIFEVCKRPDLKSKIIQSLTMQANKLLSDGYGNPIAAKQELQVKAVVSKINNCVDSLHSTLGRVGEKIYTNEFLNSLILQFNTLGGGSDDMRPAFKVWLSNPIAVLKKDLLYWFNLCNPLPECISLLLAVTRYNQKKYDIHCEKGFHTQTLDSGASYQMLRFCLPKALHAYPEVSVGRHRLSIRFVRLQVEGQGKTIQLSDPFNFNMALCLT